MRDKTEKDLKIGAKCHARDCFWDLLGQVQRIFRNVHRQALRFRNVHRR